MSKTLNAYFEAARTKETLAEIIPALEVASKCKADELRATCPGNELTPDEWAALWMARAILEVDSANAKLTTKPETPAGLSSSDVLSSIRWLLNKSEEKPKAYVGPLLDKNCNRDGVTIRQQLESLFEERTEGRRKQSERVMPMIGGLLDAWDGLSNDLKGDDELSTLRSYVERIESAMEDNVRLSEPGGENQQR